MLSWIDGVAGNQIAVVDRGLQYGDGLFETMMVRDGRIRFLQAHLDRLTDGAKRLGLLPCNRLQLAAEWQAGAMQLGTGALKALLTRGDAMVRGYAPPLNAIPRRILLGYHEALGVPPEPAAVWCCAMQLSENPVLAGMKTLNRLEQVLACAEWQQAARSLSLNLREGLLRSVNRTFVSGTAANLFWRTGSVLHTPPLDRCGIAGVIRSVVLRDVNHLGLTVTQSPAQLQDLLDADEVFLTNVRWPVLPVGSLHYDDGRKQRDWDMSAACARQLTTWLAGMNE